MEGIKARLGVGKLIRCGSNLMKYWGLRKKYFQHNDDISQPVAGQNRTAYKLIQYTETLQCVWWGDRCPLRPMFMARCPWRQIRGEREWNLGARERGREWIIPFTKFRNRKGIEEKNHSLNSGMGREWKNRFPKFRNRKGMKKIHSHNLGMGIKGYHSQKYLGTRAGMKKHSTTIKEIYLANMWREKDFLPKHSQSHLPPFLIIPRFLVIATVTINEQKSKQNDLHYH